MVAPDPLPRETRDREEHAGRRGRRRNSPVSGRVKHDLNHLIFRSHSGQGTFGMKEPRDANPIRLLFPAVSKEHRHQPERHRLPSRRGVGDSGRSMSDREERAGRTNMHAMSPPAQDPPLLEEPVAAYVQADCPGPRTGPGPWRGILALLRRKTGGSDSRRPVSRGSM